MNNIIVHVPVGAQQHVVTAAGRPYSASLATPSAFRRKTP